MITILTPSYNRAYILRRLYDSLCRQENNDFEWVIVDDGSTDETDCLVQEFISYQKFKINYLFQKNSGKHIAINTGLESAKGNWIFIVDSDDALTPDALSEVAVNIEYLSEEKPVGICFRRAYFDGRIIGEKTKFKTDVACLSPSLAGHSLKGDLAYIFRKDVMQQNLFPVIQDESFFPELYIWNKIGDMGKIYFWVNKFIYLCEYLPDGYSRNFAQCLKKNPKSFLIFYKAQFFRESNIFDKIKCLIRSFQCQLFIFLKMIK